MAVARSVVVLALVLASATACRGAGDDAARNADEGIEFLGTLLSGRAEEAATASTKLDDAIAAVRQARLASGTAARQRVESLVASARIPDEMREAFTALTWDATCAVVLDQVPADAASVASWLTEWAVRYGVGFAGSGASQWADAMLDSVQTEEAWSDAEVMCSDIGSVLSG